MIRILPLAIIVALTACARVTSPSNPPAPILAPDSMEVRTWNAMPFLPTTMHVYIYRQMEACLEHSGNFARIRWLAADFIQRVKDDVRLGGIWIRTPRRIILDRRGINDPSLVSHEEIHDILNRGDEAHEDPRFDRCVVKFIYFGRDPP